MTNNAMNILNELAIVLSRLENIYEKIEYDLPSYTGDIEDAEERFLINELHRMNEKYLSGLVYFIQYMKLPVKVEGILRKQSNGRYALDDEIELTSGIQVELFIYDKETQRHDWHVSRIEHSAKYGGYYATIQPTLNLEGIKARVRF